MFSRLDNLTNKSAGQGSDKQMIDSINGKIPLNVTQRKEIFNRALHSIPYFYKMEFPIAQEIVKTPDYKQSVGIHRDFYLTEVMSNFSQVFTDSGSLFNLSLYTSLLRSLYRYNASSLLPPSFFTQDARFRVPLATQIYTDVQRETVPILIRRSDKVYCDIINLSVKNAPATGYVVLKGFSVLDNVYVNPRELTQIEGSLTKREKYQYFNFDVPVTGATATDIQIIKQNNNEPRLILGFAVTNNNTSIGNTSLAHIQIQDISRHLRLTDSAIPVEFIAPRIASSIDQYIYYLPIEYYWKPLANLEFTINNTPVSESSFRFSILTRTV